MNELLSCDTMVALGNGTKSGNVIFAENSDRPLGESQLPRLFGAKDYPDQELLSCTYIPIPQVSCTHKVLGSKPCWIWRFECGMNEWGVATGNEAVWPRGEEEHENGLPGMGLVRLGLGRSRAACETLHVITDFLKTYGQGGNVLVTTDFHHHNPFLAADICETWILDTVDRRWVVRRVKNTGGISNCYSTGERQDEDSEDIQEHAYEMGYADRGQTSSFARVYGTVNLKLRVAYPRYKRLNQLLGRKEGIPTPDYIGSILKDHFEGEIIEPRWSPVDEILVSVCMYSIDESSSKTAVSSVVELSKDRTPVWWSCMSNPCISVFLPFTMETVIPQRMSQSSARYSNGSFRWKLERLSYELEEGYPRNTALWNPIKERLRRYVCSLTEKGLDNSLLREMVSRLEEAADEMYLVPCDTNASSNQPQRKAALRTACTMAGII